MTAPVVSGQPTAPGPRSRVSLILAVLLFAGMATWWLRDIGSIGTGLPPCEIVCSGCDMALYQAHELMTREPDLYRRDRLFAVHHKIYPQAYSHIMNTLLDVTGGRWAAQRVALGVLGFVYLLGSFLVYRRVTGRAGIAALATLLASMTRRGYPTWGLPHLKPNEIVGAASPLLLYFLYRGLTERGFIQLFTLLTVALTYTHPPTGFILLAIGAGTYLWAGRGNPHFREGLIHVALLLPITLLPLVLQRAGGIQVPPTLAMLLARADSVFFPTRATVLVAASRLVIPCGLALLIYPRVRGFLEPGARRFLEVVALVALGVSLLSVTTYAAPALARFALWFAYRYLYFSVFGVMALALWHWRQFRTVGGVLLGLGIVAVALNLDTTAVNGAQNLRYRMRAGRTAMPAAATTAAPSASPPGGAARTTAASAPDAEDATPSADDFSTRCFLADVGTWAQAHTQRDDLFLIPPHAVDAGFRVLSRRALVVADKDGGPCAYDGTTGPEWTRRIKEVDAAYAEGTRAALDRVARAYDAQYILTARKEGAPVDSAAFANDLWVVWPTHIPIPTP